MAKAPAGSRRTGWTVKKVGNPATSKSPRFYPPEDAPKPLARRVTSRQTKLRSSLKPGAVLILLAGRFKGKRCVMLKQLASGLLLVAGPFGVNGVPLRRVNAAYVIGTCTAVDVSKVDCKKFDDAYFKKPAKDRTKKSEGEFFEEKAKKELPASYIADNKAVDAALVPAIDKVPSLKGYLASRFSLTSKDKPHMMQF